MSGTKINKSQLIFRLMKKWEGLKLLKRIEISKCRIEAVLKTKARCLVNL